MPYILTIAIIIFFYWLFISSNKGKFTTNKKELTFEDVLYSEYGYIIALIAKLAKSDGHVSELEIELIENILDDLCNEFDDPKRARAHLKLIFSEEKEIQNNITSLASALYKKIIKYPFKHQKIIEFLINLAFIDKKLHAREKDIIFEIAKAFHIDSTQIETIFAKFYNFYQKHNFTSKNINEKKYLEVLGLNDNYDKKSLKEAYKKNVKLYHPDIITGKGGTKEDIINANKKLQNINEAYEYLKNKKGF